MVKLLVVPTLVAVAVVSLAVSACGQAAPTSTPTKAPAAPTKVAEPTRAAEPTKAAVAQPTAAPAKKVDFPQKGRAITLIVAVAAGGSVDTGARLLAPQLEKELGVPVQVVNKVGAGGQVGTTELALSKPDGHTIAVVGAPLTHGIYLDPDRKAAFGRKDLQALGMTVADPLVAAVRSESSFKTMKDLVDAAKANPEKVKVAVVGIKSGIHLTTILIEKVAGVKFAQVRFDGGAEGRTALLGGHVDASVNTASELLSQVKSGTVRLLGITDSRESEFYPGVKTMASQGYPIQMISSHVVIGPAGMPREIVDVLSGAIKKAMANDEVQNKIKEMGLLVRYMDAAQATTFWDELEVQAKPLLEMANQP